MKIYIAYKFRGANNFKLLRELLEKIVFALEKQSHQTFIYFRDKMNWKVKSLPPGKVMKCGFEEIRKSDAIIALIHNQGISEGMLLEFGVAKALGKKTILLISKNCFSPTLEAIADKVIRFSNFEEITKKLSKTNVFSYKKN